MGRHAPAPSGARIELADVSFARSGRTILDGVSFVAEPGTVTAVIGPSGSGKSSLLAIAAGLEMPDSGTVRVPAELRIGLVLQAYGLVSLLTAAENVEVALQAGTVGSLATPEIRRRAMAALDAVGLAGVADHLAEELSGGQQQRVAIARALVVEPHLLLADEFTAELDRDNKQNVLEIVLGVAGDGATVLLATHDDEIAARCDAVIRLVDGRVDRTGGEC